MPRKKSTEPELPPELIRQVMSAMGKKGGQAKGLRKARSSEQARAAVQARWEKERARRAQQAPGIDTPGADECPPTP
jgi:hypothetical protein